MPIEIIQQVYSLLSPVEFNAARHTCRVWFYAGFSRSMFELMLERGGWRSSMMRILPPITIVEPANLNHERVMGKWIARECALSGEASGTFVEVGYTDFSALVPGATSGSIPESQRGGLSYTVSLCGKFLLVTRENYCYIYELNHTCQQDRSRWSVPLRGRHGLPCGSLRPVSIMICPRSILACSMDTSAGRNAAAFLMEGRSGIVCEIQAERLGACINPASHMSWTESGPDSGSSSGTGHPGSPAVCVCQRYPVTQPPRIETSARSLYRGVCHEDDPPRSIALCPQRNCVAFGCASGIELHWVDAITRQDLSRWFPLTSTSDYLFFLPARRAVDTAKKLRLMSSAAAWGGPMDSLERVVHGFHAGMMESQSTSSVISVVGQRNSDEDRYHLPEGLQIDPRQLSVTSRHFGKDGFIHGVSAFSADHYRAVPLSDGYHILFTDPRSGNLCLGTDAPIGALTRLLRKVWFCPPAEAASPVPILYAAGSDVRHGVRIVATFTAADAADGTAADNHIIVFYTIPPDMFHDISRIGLPRHLKNQRNPSGDWFSE